MTSRLQDTSTLQEMKNTLQQMSDLFDMDETLEDLLHSDEAIDWDAVVARLRSHPQEATIKMEYSRTPLHWALCRHKQENPLTLTIIGAFIDAYKDSVVEVDDNGDTPIHIACWKKLSAEVVQALLEVNPGAASARNQYGRIPLHWAQSPEVVDLLLETYPEGVGVADKLRGSLPLHIEACRTGKPCRYSLRSLLKVGEKKNVGGVNGGGGVLVEDSKGKTPLMLACDKLLFEIKDGNEDVAELLWEKVYVLVRATSAMLAKQNDNVTLDKDAPLLHAVIESRCPQFVILRTVSDNPHQRTVRDYRGRTPLSIAASQHDVSSEVIKALLSTEHSGHTAAKMANKERRLPLHLATESGWPVKEGIENILQAAPAALETRDVKTRMYPFMLAAEGPHSCLNTVYTLLRASPGMAHGMARGVHWTNSKLRLQCENREQKEKIAELERENSEHLRKIAELLEREKRSNTEHLIKAAEQAKEIEKLREMNKVLKLRASGRGAKRRKLGDV